ncbi:hypothetical protein D9613_009411 [Agrocybe pediades]|uniref:non-specific serine/threonine protein kinase n=1 Tax=Agrocybe pediades TaxID=84607 RepID=A0A8H4R2Z0_9AGAR|nr:hypothetical protein D9613_009411 [Agrocybe pediades]
MNFASYPFPIDVLPSTWGSLIPVNHDSGLDLLHFDSTASTYRIGRSKDVNTHVLEGLRISVRHCTIEWDGTANELGGTKITDHSSNGTYVNSLRLIKGQQYSLFSGDSICFGNPPSEPNHTNGGIYDYRYTYQHIATPKLGARTVYEFDMKLGSGAFSEVFKATHKTTGEVVAVKVMVATQGNSWQEVRDGASNETSLIGTVKHKNICKLIEVFWPLGKEVHIVLEYMAGGDLCTFLHDTLRRPLGVLRTKDVAYQICDAVSYLHSQEIVHRDLKPENIFLAGMEGPWLNIKIGDFNLSKIKDSHGELHSMVGTDGFTAPEVFGRTSYEKGYTELVDSWSVGATLFHILTFKIPSEVPILKVEGKILEARGVCSTGQSFILHLLELDPYKRLSITMAMQHEWLKDHCRETADYQPSDDETSDEEGDDASTTAGSSRASVATQATVTEEERTDWFAYIQSLAAENGENSTGGGGGAQVPAYTQSEWVFPLNHDSQLPSITHLHAQSARTARAGELSNGKEGLAVGSRTPVYPQSDWVFPLSHEQPRISRSHSVRVHPYANSQHGGVGEAGSSKSARAVSYRETTNQGRGSEQKRGV